MKKLETMRYYKQYITVHLLVLIFAFSAQGQEKSGKQRDAANTPKKIENLANKISHKAELDTLSTRLRRLEEKNELIISENKKQYSDTKENFEKLNNTSFNINKDFTYPTILSIVSAVIFWFAFSYIPEKRRASKIRPKLELDMYNVHKDVFWIFDTVMSWSNKSPSMYQGKIKSNRLSLEDIELGLQNKCLNESYLFDKEIRDKLLVVGHLLYKLSSKIEKTVDHIFSFSQYLTADEIILLEKILKKLQTYDLANYNESAISDFNGIALRPVNPSISYMKDNLFELYQLFNELGVIIYNNKYYDWGVAIDKIQYLYSNQEYKRCIKHINKALSSFPLHKDFLGNYTFLCKYMLNKGNISDTVIDDFLNKNSDLISSRSTFKKILTDGKVEKLMAKHYSTEKIKELHNVIHKEDLLLENFNNNASILKDYYKRTSENSGRVVG